MSDFRAFGEWFHPTYRAVIDGTVVTTLGCALKLAAFTPIPVYLPDAPEPWGVVDLREFEARPMFERCGTFSRPWPVANPAPGAPRLAADEIGYHIPQAAKDEIVAWCEAFVQADPDRPMIPRTEVAYRRNTYQTTKTVHYSYNRLKDEFHLSRNEFDPGLRAARNPGTNAQNGHPAGIRDDRPRTPRADRQPRRTHAAGGATLDAFEGDRLHAVFHGYRGDDGDDAAG